MLLMHRSKNFHQGGPGQSGKKSSDNVFFFFVLNLFYRTQLLAKFMNSDPSSSKALVSRLRSQMVNLKKKKISFFKVPEGGSNFFQGRGVQLLIPCRNPYNL